MSGREQTHALVASVAASDRDIVTLAEIVSLAVIVDQRLLRAARRLFVEWRGPDLEADLWHSALVASAGATGIVLRSSVACELRSRLARDRDRYRRAREFVRDQHQWLPDTSQLEEELAYLVHVPGGLRVARSRLAALESLLPTREGWRPWADGLRARLPAELSRSATPTSALELIPAPRSSAPRPVSPDTVGVLGVPLALIDYEDTMAWMDATIEHREKGYICFATTHTVMVCNEDPGPCARPCSTPR